MIDQSTALLTVEIISFSYKKELPSILFSSAEGRHGGGFVFDCRYLPNPGREAQFKSQTGRDSEVIAYLLAAPEVTAFKTHAFTLISSAVENYLNRGFTFLTVGFGCTGGQHRSVFMTEQLSAHLSHHFASRVTTRVCHSNLDVSGKPLGLSCSLS
jgi:RNase adaptor protein for sRNA GlmZ degradation